ncbi:hypothetical protein LCGC14_0839510 [marine sediment metagenome]|uniref:Uncharacterized protein n=1 Tax=marine sediment metagenome TaxID=412755 RepID=A0A0F9SKV0_9ZZZZ
MLKVIKSLPDNAIRPPMGAVPDSVQIARDSMKNG